MTATTTHHRAVPCAPFAPPRPARPVEATGRPHSRRAEAVRETETVSGLAWATATRHPAIVNALSLNGRAAALAPEAAAAAFDALGVVLGPVAADRSDVRRSSFAETTYPIVQTGAAHGSFCLVEVALRWADGRTSLRGRPTGVAWTRHVVERRLERARDDGMATVAVAREVAPNRTLLRLAARAAVASGTSDLTVPLASGLLRGTLRTLEAQGTSLSVADGRPRVSPTPPTCLAADGLAWTGVEFVDDDLGADRDRYAALWRDCLGHPAMAWLSRVSDWRCPGDPTGSARVGAVEADLSPAIGAMLAIARAGCGRSATAA